MTAATHISRWDLDKTYLRTEFDTMRDLVRTAFERADEKRTNPGAATLLREMTKAGVSIHILSGSPEQMRRKLEDKLRLDGITWHAFTLKPNLQNMLRLRFRAVKDQLGYKLPALLRARAEEEGVDSKVKETLFGDDAEADAFVYSLYADIMLGRAGADLVHAIGEKGRVYDDVLEGALRFVKLVKPGPVVERILIHLEQQTPPGDFRVYGPRVVPFYNYLQSAFVVHEDGRLPPESVLQVAVEMVTHHRFDGDALARSYADLGKRGHLRGTGVDAIGEAFARWDKADKTAKADKADKADKEPPALTENVRRELGAMVDRLPAFAEQARARRADVVGDDDSGTMPDYLTLVGKHNRRRAKKA